MLEMDKQIEAVLFVRTEGVTIAYLSKFLNVSEAEIESGISTLKINLESRGISLIRSGNNVLLTTKPELSNIIAPLFEEETSGELSPASLQTLSIILYKKIATRNEISYIRGVDARMSIRNLMLRGLIEKSGNDSYRATTDTLRHMGISTQEDLPRFKDIHDTLQQEVSRQKGE